MRPIKFDLPLNGTRIATLEQLEDNLTPEIFVSFRSGKLAKWLRARSLDAQAEQIQALHDANILDEVQLFIKLCEVFEREVDEDDAREMIEDYKTLLASSSNTTPEKINEIQQTESPEEDKTQQAESEFEDNEPAEDLSEAQLKLLEEGNKAQCIQIATQPKLSEKVQNKLLENDAESVLVALACNPCLVEEIQAKLAVIGTPEVRKALATNPRLDEKHQNYLATAGNSDVKFKLAENPSITSAIQSMLIGGEWAIRQNLAKNSSLDVACQTKLMKDEDIHVKIALASNPVLAKDLQQQIISKGDSKVIVALAKNPSLIEALMSKLITADSSVRESLAGNPSLKLEQQAELTNTGDDDVRIALFYNPSLDATLKKRVIASFKGSDLSYFERQLARAEENYSTKENEREKASREDWDYSRKEGGLFWSEEKYRSLERAANRASDRANEANDKVNVLSAKVRKLKAILELQTK